MKSRLRLCAVLLLLPTLFACETITPIADQTTVTVSGTTVHPAFRRFDQVVTRGETVRQHQGLVETFDRGIAAATVLEEKFAVPYVKVPKRYADALENDLNTMSQIAVQDRPTPAQEAALGFTVDSLEIKAAQASKNDKNWAELVEVTVETFRGKEPIDDLIIWYCPRGWAAHLPHWERFSKRSTPTTAKLAPGMYLVAVGAPQIEPQPMRVGGDGKLSSQFQIQVP